MKMTMCQPHTHCMKKKNIFNHHLPPPIIVHCACRLCWKWSGKPSMPQLPSPWGSRHPPAQGHHHCHMHHHLMSPSYRTHQTMLLSSIPSSSKHHRRNIKTFIKFSCLDGSKVDALFPWFCHRWGQVSLLRPFLSHWEWGGVQVTSQSIRPRFDCGGHNTNVCETLCFYTICFLSW